MRKVCVVVRQLPSQIPVVSAVFETNPRIDKENPEYASMMDYYFKEKAEEFIESFCKRFPEFKDAKWYTEIIDTI